MGLFGSRYKEIELLNDLEIMKDYSDKANLKGLVLSTCVDFLARSLSQVEFRVFRNGEFVKDELYYRLNVKPNVNQSSSEFFSKLVRQLIYENECLIIKSDSDDLIIADDFDRKERAFYSDSFENIRIGDYDVKSVYNNLNSIYINYGNNKLMRFVDSMYDDYGQLFSRMLSFQLTKYQVRAVTTIDANIYNNKDYSKAVQGYLDKVKAAYEKASFANIPVMNGIKYEEVGKVSNNQESVDEVARVFNNFLGHVASALGIPLGLILGNVADVENQTNNYLKFCFKPLLNLIVDSFNSSFFEKDEYLNGSRIVVSLTPLVVTSIYSMATSLDKLVSSGMFTINELRYDLGFPESDSELADVHYITKNYQSMEGGEGDE